MNTPIDPTRCPLCGAPNDCQLAAGATSNAQCWCATKRFPRELLARVPEQARQRACICLRCLTEAVAANHDGLVSKLYFQVSDTSQEPTRLAHFPTAPRALAGQDPRA